LQSWQWLFLSGFFWATLPLLNLMIYLYALVIVGHLSDLEIRFSIVSLLNFVPITHFINGWFYVSYQTWDDFTPCKSTRKEFKYEVCIYWSLSFFLLLISKYIPSGNQPICGLYYRVILLLIFLMPSIKKHLKSMHQSHYSRFL
jgi:hypothetical protein